MFDEILDKLEDVQADMESALEDTGNPALAEALELVMQAAGLVAVAIDTAEAVG